MTMFVPVTLTPEALDALHNLAFDAAAKADKKGKRDVNADTANKWLAYAKGEVFKHWQELPEGNHLKSAYLMDVWSWDDGDLM